jgi:hypothetical protein
MQSVAARTVAFLIVCLAIGSAAFGFVPEERWGATASGPGSSMGSPITLTWGIVPDGTLIQGEGPSDLVAFFDGLFGAGSGGTDLVQRPWYSLLESTLTRWSDVTGITFAYEPHDDQLTHGNGGGELGVRADIRFGGSFIDGNNGTLAYSYFPNNSDMVIDTGDATFFSNSTSDHRAFRNTIMHEIGHGLGLHHVVSNTHSFLMEPTISIAFDGPQVDDIRGMQWYYGDALEKSNNNAGNNSATLATPLGLLEVGNVISVGSDSGPDLRVERTELDFVSIAHSGDSDYFSFDISAAVGLNAVLTPLGGVFNQGVQGGSQSQFDANSRSDLALAIFGPDGTTLLELASENSAGAIETLAGVRLPTAGRYFARVTGTSEIVQLYQLELSAIAPAVVLPGDYNQDGAVDAADYVVWRNLLAQSDTALAADGNGDGIVDMLDYDVWRDNFGQVLGTGTSLLPFATPEPAAALLIVVGGLPSIPTRRRRH